WSWDPKETWALITLVVYAMALHTKSLPCFFRPVFFHAFCVCAFLSLIITYFGVNFLLGGMHSYA
ncbi:MAG: cytochrome c biogenesis protein CcsA, partial [Sodaliphilus sp.]|nr:cytochrome c biogenesis protein CcsA [Sodaliphilus sp.]